MGYGYGFSGLLIVVGLVLALAVDYQVQGVELTTVGWIMAAVGIVLLVLAVMTNTRNSRSVQRTTHRDGTQTVSERRTDI